MNCSKDGQILPWPYLQCEMCPPETVALDGLCESCQTGFQCVRSNEMEDGGRMSSGVSFPPSIAEGYHPVHNTTLLSSCPLGHDYIQRCVEGGLCGKGYVDSIESYSCKTCDSEYALTPYGTCRPCSSISLPFVFIRLIALVLFILFVRFATRSSRKYTFKNKSKVVPDNSTKRKRKRSRAKKQESKRSEQKHSLSAFDRERLSFLKIGYLKVLLTHCQLLHTLVTVYFVPWTSPFQHFLSVFDFVEFHLNLVSGVLGCYTENNNFVVRLAVGLGFPLLIYLLAISWETICYCRDRCRNEVVGVGAAKIKRLLQRRLKRKKRRWAVMDRFVLPWLLFLYVPTAIFVTRLFVCEPPPSSTNDLTLDTGWRLEIDNAVRCYDNGYIFTVGIPAGLGIVLYVFGIPLLFVTTLRRKLKEVRVVCVSHSSTRAFMITHFIIRAQTSFAHKSQVHDATNHSQRVVAIKFSRCLYEEYRDNSAVRVSDANNQYFYEGVWELLRMFCITAMLTPLSRWPSTQLYVGLSVILVLVLEYMFGAITSTSPYQDPAQRIYRGASLVLHLFSLCTALFLTLHDVSNVFLEVLLGLVHISFVSLVLYSYFLLDTGVDPSEFIFKVSKREYKIKGINVKSVGTNKTMFQNLDDLKTNTKQTKRVLVSLGVSDRNKQRANNRMMNETNRPRVEEIRIQNQFDTDAKAKQGLLDTVRDLKMKRDLLANQILSLKRDLDATKARIENEKDKRRKMRLS